MKYIFAVIYETLCTNLELLMIVGPFTAQVVQLVMVLKINMIIIKIIVMALRNYDLALKHI